MNDRVRGFLRRHPVLQDFLGKLIGDNVGFLASALAWSLFTSIIPTVVGILAISGIVLQSRSTHDAIVERLTIILAGVFQRSDIEAMIAVATRHSGLFGVLGVIGIIWGGGNVGGAISTVFQPIFQVRGRPFWQEKLIDIGMIVILAVLVIVVALSTSAFALLDRLFDQPVPSVAPVAFGIILGLLAGFALFLTVYVIFPNVQPRFKIRHVVPGAAIAAVLFELLSFVFPLYVTVAHLTRYSAILVAIVLLSAWVYFLALILIVGAEIVSIGTLRQARREKQRPGPAPDGRVPQRIDEGA